MTLDGKRVLSQIKRLGKGAVVKTRTEGDSNAFGNTTDTHVEDRTVFAMKTYPNRNTQIESNYGDRNRDRPVFLIPKQEDQPKPPQPNDYLEYNGRDYEIKSHTTWPTHVEVFGEPVIHNEQGQ